MPSPTAPRAQRLRGTPLAVCAALSVLAAVPGCSSGRNCRSTHLDASAVRVTGQRAALTLRSHLTADGKPLAHTRVHFLIVTAEGGGMQIGDAETDADGQAVFVQRGGIGQRLMTGQRAVAYQVRFALMQELHGVAYCDTKVQAPLSCDGRSCPAL